MGKPKPIEEVFGIFYNPLKVHSYNRTYSFSVGARSIGKSTGWAIFLIYLYIKYGWEWVYVRRNADELQLTCKNWFDNAVQILRNAGYEIPDLVYQGGVYRIGDKIAGYAVPLSTEQKYKSTNFSKVHYVVYDEFLPRNGRYLGKAGSFAEVEAMESLYQTIDRGIGRPFRDETRVVFLGNAYSYYNPFFMQFSIDRSLRTDTKYLAPKNAEYVVEQTRETEATREIKKSRAYKISSENTRQSAYENALRGADGAFIEKVKAPKEGIFNIIYDGQKYGVYIVPSKGKMYISHTPTCSGVEICATTDDHRPNYLMVSRWSSWTGTIMLRQCYENGDIIFETGKCQYMLNNYMLYNR